MANREWLGKIISCCGVLSVVRRLTVLRVSITWWVRSAILRGCRGNDAGVWLELRLNRDDTSSSGIGIISLVQLRLLLRVSLLARWVACTVLAW